MWQPNFSRALSRIWRAEDARFVVAESLALAVLLLVALYVLWDSDLVRAQPWQPVFALCSGLAAYWTLQSLGRDRVAFWLLAAAVASPHLASAWSHNRIAWHELLHFQEDLVGGRSVYWDLSLFVVCLVILLILHRIIGIRRLNRQMLGQGVDAAERRVVVHRESIMIIGLIAAGLLATGVAVAVAVGLDRSPGLADESPLAIATIGGVATVLLALTLWLWFRDRRRPPDLKGR